ncbi:MAG: hypothetical protein AMJ81_02170 [Phycisphaerae bacterium SM23_33]|nr:MAG: hypothetical protein AMJ81_02170 [Phycisphaerae bacterium SM23_33]
MLALDEACFDFCLDYRMLTEEPRWLSRQVRAIRRELGVSTAQAERVYAERVKRTWDLAERLSGASRNEMSQAAQAAIRRVRAIHEIVGGDVREEIQPHAIVTGLDEPAAVALRLRLEEMIGACVLPSHHRWYPFGEDACHVIGRVGQVSAAEQRAQAKNCNSPLEAKLTRYLDGDMIGKSGVEKACEGPLRGRRGYRRTRRAGQVVQEIKAEFGKDIRLTLDLQLQQKVADALGRMQIPDVPGNRRGAAVVIDVPTGEVLAMVSLPTYDLNRYRQQFPKLAGDTLNLPLWNRCVSVLYPPGSTFKPMAAIAGLGSGRIDAHSQFDCPGYLVSPTYEAFRCWIWQYRTGHGSLDVVGALEHSCNVFFYKLGQRLGLARQVEWLGKMGFADPPGTGLPEERPSRLPDPVEFPGPGEARYLAIGQGTVGTTPLHVANGMATIARGGEFRSPLLLEVLDEAGGRWRPFQPQRVRRLPIAPELVHLVQEGMWRVVNSPNGTAYSHARGLPVETCAKTGTAETAPQRRGIDDDGDGRIDRWGEIVRVGNTAWFAGYAPYRNPRIAFAIVVEYSPVSGGPTCAPIARKILQDCRELGYL